MHVESALILDRYRPLSELGEGGYGTVVLAWDTRMQRRVAIKRLTLPLDAAGRPHRPPGLAEARTAAMLNHPSIVTVFDFDTDSDEAFLVMEFVDGASLAEVLDHVGGPLTLDEAAAVVEAVASALQHAHDNGVLHLDIKPENVLIDRDGRVKVADFGLATLSSLTGHGSAVGGTPGYMPIEQLEGGRVDARTDSWGLAVLAYECLTGDNPFAETSVEAAIIRLETVEPPPPSHYEPELAGAVDDVLLAALGMRPRERYQTASDFADAMLPNLGDPGLGRESLAEIVSAYAEEPLDDTPGIEHLGLWDRAHGRAAVILARAAAAIESGWLAWAGLSPLALEQRQLVAAAALVAAAGALAPPLGVGLGLACLVAGLAASGAPVAAGALAVGGAVWWWLLARRSSGAAVLPLAAPALGALWVPFLQPFLAGFSLRPLRAAITGLLGGVLALLASAVTLNGIPYVSVSARLALDPWAPSLAENSVRALVTSGSAWVALLGWPLAAWAMSLGCSRATRGGALAGVVAGTGMLSVAYLVADLMPRPYRASVHWTGSTFVLALAGSLILMLLVVALGAPIRAEETESTRRRAAGRD